MANNVMISRKNRMNLQGTSFPLADANGNTIEREQCISGLQASLSATPGHGCGGQLQIKHIQGAISFMTEHRHLKRLDHIWISNPRYYITVCTAERVKVLASERVVEILLAEWEGSLIHRGWAVGSYCVMPDHAHFFCTDESYSEKWDYVWRNPVRAELVSDPDDWPFSGFVHYK